MGHCHRDNAATACSSTAAGKEQYAGCSLTEAIENVEGSVAAAEGLLNVLLDEVRTLNERLCPVPPPAALPIATPQPNRQGSSVGSSTAADHTSTNRALAVANDQLVQMESMASPSPLPQALAAFAPPCPPSAPLPSSGTCFLPGALVQEENTASIS